MFLTIGMSAASRMVQPKTLHSLSTKTFSSHLSQLITGMTVGALPAKGISLKDSSGKVFGPWTVITSAGSGGRANVNWECHPGIVLPAGTYTIIDPDTSTWSQNDGSGNSGFVRVAGSPGKK